MRYQKRFLSAIDRIVLDMSEDPATGCWVWQGTISPRGYAVICIGNKLQRAHRVAYEAIFGPIPAGKQLDHLCRLRRCVNPFHVEPVTCRENLMRGNTLAARFARATHCVNGHAFTPANTGCQRRRGRVVGRKCRTCERNYMQRKRANV